VSEVTLPMTPAGEVTLTVPVQPPAAPSGAPGAPTAVEPGTEPPLVGLGPVVYVQQDADDPAQVGEAMVEQLRAEGMGVVSGVERLPTNRMPPAPQVRYFREADRAAAEQALAVLNRTHPDAKLVLLRLPAPAGQLEVWLPKGSRR
jgi:hypothetical protein